MNSALQKFIKSDKFILVIFGVVVLVLGSILVLSLMRKNQLAAQPNSSSVVTIATQNPSVVPSPQSNQSNPLFYFFSWIFPSQHTAGQSGQITPSQSTTAGQNGTTSQPSAQQIVQPTSSSPQLGGKTAGSSGGSTSSSTGSSYNPNATSFQITFLGPNGQVQTYVPPSTPPIQVTWARYVNTTDHYAVDYPSNWQLKTQNTNGHAGISLFLPNANISDPNQQYVGFGWSSYNLFPANDPSSQSYATAAMVAGVTGTLYTHGTIGNSYIIAIFPYNGGYFGIGSTASDPTFAYVYQHMLSSLTFGN